MMKGPLGVSELKPQLQPLMKLRHAELVRKPQGFLGQDFAWAGLGVLRLEMAKETLLSTHGLQHSSLATPEVAFGPHGKLGSRCIRKDVE